MIENYNKINKKLEELSKSKFRNSFHLRNYMIKFIDEKGMDTVKSHAIDFIESKLNHPVNDGKQTPMKGHPVFIAMHACGCCCRSCLYKWHHIPKDKELSSEDKQYILSLLMIWIIREYKSNN